MPKSLLDSIKYSKNEAIYVYLREYLTEEEIIDFCSYVTDQPKPELILESYTKPIKR